MSSGGDSSQRRTNSLRDWTDPLEIVRFDYEQTIDFIGRIVTTAEAIRAGSITATVAITGFSLANGEGLIALTAVPVLIAALVANAYHDFLYSIGRARATEIERIIDAFQDIFLEQGRVKARAETQLLHRMDKYQFGMTRSLRRPKPRDLYAVATDRSTYALYPVFIVVAVGACALA